MAAPNTPPTRAFDETLCTGARAPQYIWAIGNAQHILSYDEALLDVTAGPQREQMLLMLKRILHADFREIPPTGEYNLLLSAGAIKGAMSATAAITQAILLRLEGMVPKEFFAASSGVANILAMLLGDWQGVLKIWDEDIASADFFNLSRANIVRAALLGRGGILNVDYLVDEILDSKHDIFAKILEKDTLNTVSLCFSVHNLSRDRNEYFVTPKYSEEHADAIDDRFHILDEHNLKDAVRAAMAIPLAHGRPVPIDDELFADGGVDDPVPSIVIPGIRSRMTACISTHTLINGEMISDLAEQILVHSHHISARLWRKLWSMDGHLTSHHALGANQKIANRYRQYEMYARVYPESLYIVSPLVSLDGLDNSPQNIKYLSAMGILSVLASCTAEEYS